MSIKGEKIRHMREVAGFTQTELAKKSGVPYRTIQRWEGTESIYECNLAHMLRLCQTMQCSLQDLVEDGQILRIRNKKQRL